MQDCHGGSKDQGRAPIKDEVDNYRLIAGMENDTHTVIEFRRALDTCDSDDYVLGVRFHTCITPSLSVSIDLGTKLSCQLSPICSVKIGTIGFYSIVITISL